MAIPLFQVIRGDLPGQQLPHPFQMHFQIVGMRQFLKGFRLQFLLIIAQHPAQREVHLQPAAIQSYQRRCRRRRWQRRRGKRSSLSRNASMATC